MCKENMPSDDELVLLYLEIGNLLTQLPLHRSICIIRNVEKMFDSEADTELGDYLDDLFKLYAYTPVQHYNELHSDIRTLIYESELDYEMLFSVGSCILEEIYIKHYLPEKEVEK